MLFYIAYIVLGIAWIVMACLQILSIESWAIYPKSETTQQVGEVVICFLVALLYFQIAYYEKQLSKRR